MNRTLPAFVNDRRPAPATAQTAPRAGTPKTRPAGTPPPVPAWAK